MSAPKHFQRHAGGHVLHDFETTDGVERFLNFIQAIEIVFMKAIDVHALVRDWKIQGGIQISL